MNVLIGSKQRRAICQGFNLKPEVEKQTFILSLESNKVKINAERIQKPLIWSSVTRLEIEAASLCQGDSVQSKVAGSILTSMIP